MDINDIIIYTVYQHLQLGAKMVPKECQFTIPPGLIAPL